MLGGLSMLGGFGVALDLDTRSYTRGIINAETMNRVFGQSVTAFLSNPLLGAAAITRQVTGAFVRKSQVILSDVEAMQRLSDTTGVSVELLGALRQRLDLSHGAGERAAGAMLAFARRVDRAKRSTGAAAASVKEFGIDLTQFSSTDEALKGVLDVINSFENPTRRAALAADFFGDEAGPMLVNSIGGGSDEIAKMSRQAEDLGYVLDRQTVDSVARLNTLLGMTGQAFDGVTNRAVTEFLAAFSQEITGSEESISDLAGTINDRLIPIANDAGAAAGRLIGDLDAMVDKIEEILDRIANSPLADMVDSNISVARQLNDGSFWSTPVGQASVFVPTVNLWRGSTQVAGEAAEWFFLGE